MRISGIFIKNKTTNLIGGLFSAILCTFYAVTAHAVPGAVDDAWGTPQYIGSAWEVGKSRDPITLMPDMEFWLLPKHKPANADKEAVIVAYVARIINQNGGYFCATQVRARNRNKGTRYNDSWTIYQVPDGDSEKTCFWLCEPGYTGENCKKVDAANPANTEDICAYTRLSVENLSQFVSYNETGGKEEKSVEGAMNARVAVAKRIRFWPQKVTCPTDTELSRHLRPLPHTPYKAIGKNPITHSKKTKDIFMAAPRPTCKLPIMAQITPQKHCVCLVFMGQVAQQQYAPNAMIHWHALTPILVIAATA